MTVFWVIAALLIIAALLFVLPPLLRKDDASKHVSHKTLNIKIYQDQKAELELDLANKIISNEQYEQSIQEMEQRLLQDVDADTETHVAGKHGGVSRASSIFVAIFIPLGAVYLYQELGNPQAITGQIPVNAANSADGQDQHVDTGVQVEEMITQLAERLKANPNDMEGWLMLARSLRFQKHYAEAVKAFEQAMPAVRSNAQLLADYADTLAMANNGVLEGKPIELIKRALQLDPNHIQGLWLAGTYEYDKGNYGEALRYWQQLHSLFPPDSKDAQSMERNIAEVKARLNSEGAPVPSSQTPVSMDVSGTPESDQDVEELKARLAANPDDVEGWLVLARMLHSLQKYTAAVAAFEKAMPVVEKSAQALAEYADTQAMANNGTLEGKPIELVKQALELNPNHIQSLWLAGTYEYDTENYGEALRYWQQLHRIVPPDSQDAQTIATNIAEVQARLNGTEAPLSGQEVPPVSAALAKVGGTVTLDSTLLDQVADTDTVFIFARAASGPKMPLAILRKQVSDLPVSFSLDQSMAMMPSMSLANFQQIIVGARITKSGNAMPQSGDLHGLSAVINVGTSDLEINIDSVIP